MRHPCSPYYVDVLGAKPDELSFQMDPTAVVWMRIIDEWPWCTLCCSRSMADLISAIRMLFIVIVEVVTEVEAIDELDLKNV